MVRTTTNSKNIYNNQSLTDFIKKQEKLLPTHFSFSEAISVF